MQGQIEKIIKKVGVTVVYNDLLDADGHYISEINVIVINSSRPEIEQQKALLHELGHACKHHNYFHLYNVTFALHSKMECEADYYMIERLLYNYMNTFDLEMDNVNYMNFIDYAGLSSNYEPIVIELIKDYFIYS